MSEVVADAGESRSYTQSDLQWAQGIPKVELHAHLNGSIRRSTLQELAFKAGLDAGKARIEHGDERSLSEMFAVFSVVHQTIRGPELLRRVSREVLEDFEADGVAYLELRTTPRVHHDFDMSKQDYLEAVLAGFGDHQQRQGSNCKMTARLILSIDRSDPPETALDTVHLALRYRSRGVAGIDLSGNPTKGAFSTWLPALQLARQDGLSITLHAGEVRNDKEMAQILDFKPVCFWRPFFLQGHSLTDSSLGSLGPLLLPRPRARFHLASTQDTRGAVPDLQCALKICSLLFGTSFPTVPQDLSGRSLHR